MIALKTDLGDYRELVGGGFLEDATGNKYPVKDRAEAMAFLRAHPDTDYVLEHGQGELRKLDGEPDPEKSLLCGYVRLESATGEVVSRPQVEIIA